jgi:hypothetical protein
MGQKFDEISDKLKKFIEDQKIFFVATAAADGRVNLSPKGMDSLRIIAPNRMLWLNVTGSGNETAAHVLENPRMTLMFCSFSGDPLILKIYGKAKAILPGDREWDKLYPLFDPLPGARQIFDLTIEFALTSCGMGVPCFDYADDRNELIRWAEKKGEEGIMEYWKKENQVSIDGKPTGFIKK